MLVSTRVAAWGLAPRAAILGISRSAVQTSACLLAIALLSLLPTRAEAQYGYLGGGNGYLGGGYGYLGGGGLGYLGGGGLPGIGNGIGNQANQGVQRATSSLANPINFYQYGQVTGVGPIRGTVRIYNQFGLLGQQGQMGGMLGGLGGIGGIGGGQQQLPGMGATQGDDPPQGVLLHVNYANMFLPNQQQINQGQGGGFGGAGIGGFGGVPGFGGFGGGFGKGGFGNGAGGI